MVQNFQKTFYLNSLIKNFKKIEINFKDKDSSTQVSIQSANKTLKQEIVKMLEIEQKLGFFEISIYSINSLHSKIKQKMIEIRGTKKDIFKDLNKRLSINDACRFKAKKNPEHLLRIFSI